MQPQTSQSDSPNLYWHLELYSGEIIKIKPNPENIKLIQEMIRKQEGAVTTPTRSIIIKDVRDFRLSDEVYVDENQKLLEGTAQAFDEPVYLKDGSVVARWMKKSVPKRRWDTHYRFITGYKFLGENDNYVSIAFRVPIHLINYSAVSELSGSELIQLDALLKSD